MNAEMKLSPLTRHGITSRILADGERQRIEGKKGRRQVEEVTVYRCPKCGDLHEYRSDAETCCQVSAEESLSGTNCPVCGESHYDHRNAADCCLWKDLDGPTRWRIADAVEAGSEWVEELGMTALSMLPNGAKGAH